MQKRSLVERGLRFANRVPRLCCWKNERFRRFARGNCLLGRHCSAEDSALHNRWAATIQKMGSTKISIN